MADIERLLAYWYSLKYQRPEQIRARLRYWLAWKVYPRFVRTLCEPDARSVRPRAGFCWPAAYDDHPIAPPEPGPSLLTQFRMHYFDWPGACEPSVIKKWIAENPPGTWPSWHPYPTSLRIVHWIRAFQDGIDPAIADSLATQAAFLERNLEFHLGGNHLLENARALLAAGFFFEGGAAGRWRIDGLDLLLREIQNQVLPDGGHFERSPWYHHCMTELVLDALALLGAKAPRELHDAAERMMVFDVAVRHTDGSLPLFHDSLDPPSSRPAAGPQSFPDSGYYILEGSHGRLIADYGAPGDSYNPGHQHAGIFSFEISAGSEKVIVDSGTATYDPGPERQRLRCTAAHNTVRVDGYDQFQIWGAFRVGRRAWVSPVDEDRNVISASHNGYARFGVEHRRTIRCIPNAGWLIVDDLLGRGEHRLESFVHLAPGLSARVQQDGACIAPLGWILRPFGMETMTGEGQTLVMRTATALPHRFGYFIGPAAPCNLDDLFSLKLGYN